ncbi:hypothetical protein Btru_047269 [Bulinus truncatus]|nr:hypothetical protein Btru_047269 [Bulinus truncatus]
MAEANTNSKIGLFAKAQKQISRTKTKVLQNLGKAEKTTDDVFKDYVLKLDRQQEVAQHLQKELKTYAHCVRDLSQACKSLQNAFLETYEPEWTEESQFKSQIQAFELLWNDYLQKLQDSVINNMNAYLQSFPVLKSKVSKRGRKLVDYDNSRHNAEVLQSSKKRDEFKIQKAQEDLKDVKRIFDELNNELHTELPEFYNSRVSFYADLYSRFFGAEQTLHSEVGKTSESITEIAQSLAKDFEHYKYQPKRPISVTKWLSIYRKELKTYAHCVRDLSQACKSLQTAFLETYEPEWTEESQFKSQIQAFELLWNDYLQSLQDSVINPMNAYLQSFPVLKSKVSKRGRKLVDYDNSRHNAEVLQSSKKRDEFKIQKAQEDLKDVKRIFDELNNELHTELPEFYNSRVTFYAGLYSRFFGAEHTLHSEVGKTSESITEIAQSLAKDFEHYKYQPKRPISVTDSSVNGETPVTASPNLRSSHSPQKELVYSNQDEINLQQSMLKPKRKAPIAPGHFTPVPLIQAGVSCISLDNTSSQQSNLSISSESHLSVKSDNLKDNSKYFTKWKERFRLKRSKQILSATENGFLEQQKGLEGPVCNNLVAAVSKVQGVKSLEEKLVQSADNAQSEKRKTLSLPDYLQEDKSSEPGIMNLMPGTSLEKEGVASALSTDGHAEAQEKEKMNPAFSHLSFSIAEDFEEGKLENRQLTGSVDSEPSSDSAGHGGALQVKKKAVRISDTTVVFSDDAFQMKNDTVDDAELGLADLNLVNSGSQSNLPDSIPDKTVTLNVNDDDAGEFSPFPNDPAEDLHFVPLDEIAKKHLFVKKSKTLNHVSVREQQSFPEVLIHKSAPELDHTLGVNLQLLPDVKRNDSSIKWNKEKHLWVNKEMYSSDKTEVCPLLSDEDEDQYASCCDDFYKMPTLPESNPLPTIKENLTDDKLPVQNNTPTGSKSVLDSSKNFYRTAFIESSSSAEDEPETSWHRIKLMMTDNPVQKTEQVGESEKLFNKEKLNFLSQHLSKKHSIQSRKVLDGLSHAGSTRREMDTMDGGKEKFLKEHLVKKHLLPSSGHDREEETEDIKSECMSYNESEVESGQDEVSSVDHSASVDLPKKKSKSPARKTSEGQNANVKVTSGSRRGRLPVETMPESWKDDNLKNDYEIITVFTEDLSPSAVTGTELSGPDVNSLGASMKGKTALTVNLCLNELSPKFCKLLPDQSPEIDKERLLTSSEVLSESDSSTYTNCPKHRNVKPKSMDKPCSPKKTKLNRAESLDDKSLRSRKVTEDVRYMKSDRSARDDTDIGSMSDSSVSFAVTAQETLMKEESGSEPSVSMASNRWNLRGLVSMLMPVTVQTLASHTKSYINSYLSSNKPSERDAIEIQKIIAENLSKEDYYNLIGKSRDSSVDISIHLEELTAMPDDTLTTQDDFKSFSAAVKLDEPDAGTALEVDKRVSDSNMTHHLSEHECPTANISPVTPEMTKTEDKEKQQYDSSDLDILEKHFHTVLLDIVSKGSSQLKKSSEMARKPKSAFKLVISEKQESDSSRPENSQKCESMLTVEDLDKESSYNLHDAMLSRLQMSLPLLSKSQGKNESGAVSEDGSLDNACSWTFSKESLLSKSSADEDVQQGKDEMKAAPENGFTSTTRQGATGSGQKRFAEPLSPPLDLALQKSLAIRRDALNCPAEDDDCLTNSSLDDSDQCTHASQNSVDADHSTIFLGHCYDPLADVGRCVTACCTRDKEKYVLPTPLKSYGTFTHETIAFSQNKRDNVCDSNFLMTDDSSSSTSGWSSHESIIIIEDKDMMDFKDIVFQCENYLTTNTVGHVGEKAESFYNKNTTEVLNEQKNASSSTSPSEGYLNNLKIKGHRVDESAAADIVDSQHECKIGDTADGYCVVSHEAFSGDCEDMKDFGAGDDENSDAYFNRWDHDEEKAVDAINSEDIWVEHKLDEVNSKIPFCALGHQPERNDLNKMDVNESSQDLTMSESPIKNSTLGGALQVLLSAKSPFKADSFSCCEVIKKEKKVRFSDFVEVCSGVESEQVMGAEGCVPHVSMTFYRDTLNDFCMEDCSDRSGGHSDTTADLNSWGNDQFHSQLDWGDEPADCDLVHSVQFTNSQYMSDESSFYKKSGDKYMREAAEASSENTQCTQTEVQPTEACIGSTQCTQFEVLQPTDNFIDVDILVHIQPIYAGSSGLKCALSLLDEELANIKSESSLAPALRLNEKMVDDVSSVKKLAGATGEARNINLCFENAEVVNADQRYNPEIKDVNDVLSLISDNLNVIKCHKDNEPNLNTFNLDLDELSSVDDSSYNDYNHKDMVGPGEQSSDDVIVKYQSQNQMLSAKKHFCTCRNIICTGCNTPSTHMLVEHSEFHYVPLKFTASLEGALKMYQETHFNPSFTQMFVQESSCKSIVRCKSESKESDVENMTYIKHSDLNDRPPARAVTHLKSAGETAACEGRFLEDIINCCPSVEVALLTFQPEPRDRETLEEILEEFKTDETELFAENKNVNIYNTENNLRDIEINKKRSDYNKVFCVRECSDNYSSRREFTHGGESHNNDTDREVCLCCHPEVSGLLETFTSTEVTFPLYKLFQEDSGFTTSKPTGLEQHIKGETVLELGTSLDHCLRSFRTDSMKENDALSNRISVHNEYFVDSSLLAPSLEGNSSVDDCTTRKDILIESSNSTSINILNSGEKEMVMNGVPTNLQSETAFYGDPLSRDSTNKSQPLNSALDVSESSLEQHKMKNSTALDLDSVGLVSFGSVNKLLHSTTKVSNSILTSGNVSRNISHLEQDLSRSCNSISSDEKYALFMPATVEPNSLHLCTDDSSESAESPCRSDRSTFFYSGLSEKSGEDSLVTNSHCSDQMACDMASLKRQTEASRVMLTSQMKRDSSKSEINGHKAEHPVTERPVSAPRTLIGMKSSLKKSDDSDEDVDNEDEDDDQKDTNIYVEPVEPQMSPAAANTTTSDSGDSSGSEDEHAVTSTPPHTLYKVQATHKYVGEDDDELSFEAGEIIYVIEFENPDEQDDGWQMGIKMSDGRKGVFPENFTQQMS